MQENHKLGRIKLHGPILAASVFFLLMLGYVTQEFIQLGAGSEIMPETQWPESQNIIRAIIFLALSGLVLLSLSLANTIEMQRLQSRTARSDSMLREQMDAIEACGDGIAVLDKDGHYTFMNKAHAQCYGYDSPADLIGKHWHTLYEDSRAKTFDEEVFPVLAEVGEWRGRSFGRSRDGAVFPQEIRLNRLNDGGIVCIVRDITEKVQNESLLNMIKIAVEAANDGVAIADQQNRIVFMNRSFLRMNGYNPYKREEYMGMDWRQLYNVEGREQINTLVLPETHLKGAWSGCINVMRPDGTMFYADASLTKLHDGKVVGVMRDATDRKNAEIELQGLHEELYQSQKMEAIGRFTQGMARDFEKLLHEIDKQISSVRNSTLPQLANGFQFDKLERICDNLHETVDKLQYLSFSREYEDDVADLSECLMRLQVKMAQNTASNITPIVEIKIPESFVAGQEDQIMAALDGLLANAVNSIGNKQGKIAICLKEADRNLIGLKRQIVIENTDEFEPSTPVIRSCKARGKNFLVAGHILKGMEYHQITVTDTGEGIEDSLLPRIFDPFFHGGKSENRSGVGLYMVLVAITSLQGAIIVDNVRGEGTSFHLFFPTHTSLDANLINLERGIGAA